MGNVMAASSSTPSSAAASLDKAAKLGIPEPAGPATGFGSAVQTPDKESKLDNPGTVEELHKKCKGMYALIYRHGEWCDEIKTK